MLYLVLILLGAFLFWSLVPMKPKNGNIIVPINYHQEIINGQISTQKIPSGGTVYFEFSNSTVFMTRGRVPTKYYVHQIIPNYRGGTLYDCGDKKIILSHNEQEIMIHFNEPDKDDSMGVVFSRFR